MSGDLIDLAGVLRVMPDNLATLWPQLEPIMQPAVALSGTHSLEDVRRGIMAMRAQLWVQMRRVSHWEIAEDLKCPHCKDGDLETKGQFYSCDACGWSEEDHARPEVVSAAVTEFVDYPKGLFLRVWLAGATPHRRMDMDAFLETLDRWRIANGCVEFELVGRPGWARVFPWARMAGLVMRGAP